jgi:FkbM family methyltransferase
MAEEPRTAVRRQSWFGLKRYVKGFLGLRIPHAAMRGLLRLNPGLRSPRLPAPRAVKEVRGVAEDVTFVMVRPDRCEIAKELYWGRGRRPRPADDFAVRLFVRLARKADVVLDVGAYTGIFTLVGALAAPEGHVHAFEVVPEVYKTLFDNCVRNDVLSRVTLHHVGVGEPDRAVRFPAGTGGSALPSFYSTRMRFDAGVLVGFRSLDWVGGLMEANDRVLMKVDVEGTESEVFAFGQGFLSAHRPDVLCEVLFGVADPERLEALLAPHGYRFYLVGEGELVPRPGIVPNERLRDWLFTTRDAEEVSALLPVRAGA